MNDYLNFLFANIKQFRSHVKMTKTDQKLPFNNNIIGHYLTFKKVLFYLNTKHMLLYAN